jgi:hypothetical protein
MGCSWAPWPPFIVASLFPPRCAGEVVLKPAVRAPSLAAPPTESDATWAAFATWAH